MIEIGSERSFGGFARCFKIDVYCGGSTTLLYKARALFQRLSARRIAPMNVKVRTVCGPMRKKAALTPFHNASTPSVATTLRRQWRLPS